MPKKVKKYKQQMKEIEKDMKQKIMLFEKLPDECTACETEFDKSDSEMVHSWNVVVKGESVRVYCPKCWEAATKTIADFKKRVESSKR